MNFEKKNWASKLTYSFFQISLLKTDWGYKRQNGNNRTRYGVHINWFWILTVIWHNVFLSVFYYNLVWIGEIYRNICIFSKPGSEIFLLNICLWTIGICVWMHMILPPASNSDFLDKSYATIIFPAKKVFIHSYIHSKTLLLLYLSISGIYCVFVWDRYLMFRRRLKFLKLPSVWLQIT